MKNRCIIFWLVFMALAACGPYPRESKRMAEAFEQAQLVYGKGENDTLLFIPELDKASAYYARKRDYGKAALAALYHGYAEKDYDKTLAMNAFKEAEQYGELVHDSLTVARAQYQMGRMLYGDYMHEESLSMFKKSDVNFGSHYGERALVMNAQSCLYILLHDYDNADSCLRKSLSLAEQCNSCKAKQKALNNYAKLYQLQGEYDKAISCLRMVKPEDEQQKVLNHLNLGSVFMAIGEMDSAAYYLNLVEKSFSNNEVRKETKVAFYRSFSKMKENQGDYLLALSYMKKHDELQYEVQKDLEQKNIYRIQKKYDYEAIENEVKVEKVKNLRNSLILVSLILVAFIVIVTMVFRHKRMLRKEQELEKELDSVKQDLLTSVDVSKVDEEILWRLNIILKVKQFNKEGQSTKKKQDIMKRYILNGAENLYDAAATVINYTYPTLYTALQSKYPDLNETELRVCMLSVKGLTNSDIADILGLSDHAVNKSRSTIYKKMGIEKQAFQAKMREMKSSLS